MAQTFSNGESNASIRTKLNANAAEIDSNSASIESLESDKVDKSLGLGLSEENYTTVEKGKLTGIESQATKNSSDAFLLSRTNHTGTQNADTITNGSMNKVFTSSEQAKLATLNNYYLGSYASLSALQTAHPTGSAGQYATVDAGAGEDAVQYIWDVSDTEWVAGGQGNVASVNGQTGAVSLTTDTVPEGAKKYFTNSLSIGAVLTGFVAAVGHTAVIATDSILAAFQKVAGSISDIYTQLSSKLNQSEVDARVNNGLEATTIYFDNVTLKLQNPELPMSNENPLVATAIPNVTNAVTNGDMNAVTSNAVYLALQPVLQDILDIYEAISSGLAPATAPTAFVVDDVADTADWTNTVGFTDVSDYEYQINGGTITTVTEKPINVGNINAAIGDVKIRVKGVPGETSPSAWLTNPTAYFAIEEGNYLTGFTPIVLDDNVQDTGKPLSNDDGSWFTTYDSSYFISSTVLAEGDRIALLLTATDSFIFGVTTSELFNPKGLYYSLADGLRLKESGDVTAFAVQPVTGDFLIFEAHAAGPKVYKVTAGVETELVVPSNFIESLQNVSGAIFGANNTLSYPSIKRA